MSEVVQMNNNVAALSRHGVEGGSKTSINYSAVATSCISFSLSGDGHIVGLRVMLQLLLRDLTQCSFLKWKQVGSFLFKALKNG